MGRSIHRLGPLVAACLAASVATAAAREMPVEAFCRLRTLATFRPKSAPSTEPPNDRAVSSIDC